MTSRIAKTALAACFLMLLPGCVEMTQTITLNPDGKGKMKIEIKVAAYDLDMGAAFGAPGEKKVKSLDEIKKDAITKFVSESKGVTAFKDVSVNWTRDGKLHMVGTAYFDKLDDLNREKEEKGPPNPGNIEPSSTFRASFEVTIDKSGTMRIAAKNQGIQEGVNPLKEQEKPVDLAKLTDKEAEEYLLKQRVEYQKIRPFFEMMFNDLKITTVLHLPGDISEVKGFKKDGARTVSQSIEGAVVLATMKKMIMMDGAELKKLMGTNGEKDLKRLLGSAGHV